MLWKNRKTRKNLTPSTFYSSIAKSDFGRIVEHLNAGFNPNCYFASDGERPIHVAAAHANVEIIELLVRRGADVFVGIRIAGQSAILPSAYARLAKNEAVIQRLIELEAEAKTAILAKGGQPPELSSEFRITRCSSIRKRPSISPPPV